MPFELVGGGRLPTAEVLSVERFPKPADLPAFGSSAEGNRIRRLRSLGGKPAALAEIWLDGSRVETLAVEDLSESLYLYYRKALGLWIARAEDRIGVDDVPAWAPTAFGLPAGAPAGFIERIGWSREGDGAECSRTWFDHRIARYVSRMR